jgi:large subunit ribosomal protein L15
MDLHNLQPAKGSVKSRKRIARGQGSGKGGTATKGHKGAKSRSGYKSKRNFEGGQMPLQMRLPKRGFKSLNRTEYFALNLDRIQEIAEKYNLTDITVDVLIEKGICKKSDTIKLLGRGELKSKLNVSLHACSAAAKASVEEKGGTLTIV